jgi:hypothetical protein
MMFNTNCLILNQIWLQLLLSCALLVELISISSHSFNYLKVFPPPLSVNYLAARPLSTSSQTSYPTFLTTFDLFIMTTNDPLDPQGTPESRSSTTSSRSSFPGPPPMSGGTTSTPFLRTPPGNSPGLTGEQFQLFMTLHLSNPEQGSALHSSAVPLSGAPSYKPTSLYPPLQLNMSPTAWPCANSFPCDPY